jgi:peptide deformylase
MKSLGIRTYGDPVLRKRSEPVKEFGAELVPLFEQMKETMIVERGVGLAANQVGIARQIAVMNPEPDEEKTLIRMANPRVVAASDELETIEEGCLSVPGVRAMVTRHSWVEIAYQDEKGKQHRLKAEGLLARIVQHEIDHLNGVLFIDRLSLAKRSLIKTKLRSIKKGGGET